MTESTPDGRAQAVVLRSVLTGRPVPGSHSPCRPADLSLATDPDGTVRVLATDLSPEAADVVRSPGTPARLVPATEVSALRSAPGVAAVLRLRPPEVLPGPDRPRRVRVTVEVCAAREHGLLPLDSLMVVLRQEDGGWVLDGPPTGLAT